MGLALLAPTLQTVWTKAMTSELHGPGIPKPMQDPTDYADTASCLRDFAEGLEVEPWEAATEAAVKLREAIALLQTLTETEDE